MAGREKGAAEMTIDDAEIARLREIAGRATQDRWHSKSALETAFYPQDASYIATFHPPKVLALLDELEKARELNEKAHVALGITRGQRDSARALLREIAP